MFATFIFTLSALIFITANAVWTIQDEWRMIRLLNKEYHIERDWSIILFASLSTIILWVFYLYSIIKWLS